MITVLEERPAGAPSNGHGLSSPGHQPQHGVRLAKASRCAFYRGHDVTPALSAAQSPVGRGASANAGDRA